MRKAKPLRPLAAPALAEVDQLVLVRLKHAGNGIRFGLVTCQVWCDRFVVTAFMRSKIKIDPMNRVTTSQVPAVVNLVWTLV